RRRAWQQGQGRRAAAKAGEPLSVAEPGGIAGGLGVTQQLGELLHRSRCVLGSRRGGRAARAAPVAGTTPRASLPAAAGPSLPAPARSAGPTTRTPRSGLARVPALALALLPLRRGPGRAPPAAATAAHQGAHARHRSAEHRAHLLLTLEEVRDQLR